MTRLEITAKNEDGSMYILVMEDADATVTNGEGKPDTLQAIGRVISFESYIPMPPAENPDEQTDGTASE